VSENAAVAAFAAMMLSSTAIVPDEVLEKNFVEIPPFALILPETSSFSLGLEVPMPTLPEEAILSRSVPFDVKAKDDEVGKYIPASQLLFSVNAGAAADPSGAAKPLI
jgi:hypothetical protein